MKQSYSEKLKDPRWQKRRLEVLSRDNFKCTCCGDEKTTLHVHHEKYNGEPWEANLNDLKTVCEHCHILIEYIKRSCKWMVEFVEYPILKVRFPSGIVFYVRTTGFTSIYIYNINNGKWEDEFSIDDYHLDNIRKILDIHGPIS